jgi:transposase
MEAETFVGLDVSRKGAVVTAVDPLGQLIDQSSLGPTDAELIAYLQRLPGTKHVALEACTMWEHFHDAAVAAGADVVLSHPYRTRLIADASLKSDKVDSEALATLLRLRALPTAFVPSDESRALRRTVRDRIFYRRLQKAVANHTYALLLTKGIPYDDGILGLKRRREELRSLHLPEVDRGLDRLCEFDLATRDLDATIHTAFLKSKEAQLLESIPGVGELTAVTLVAFLCPIDRFASFEDLSSYCGLCPTNYQTAETSYKGKLKSDCNHILRWMLVEASYVHRTNARGSYVSRVGRRGARRKGAKRGAIDAAHALLRVAYAILKRGTPYTLHAPERPSCNKETATSSRTVARL